MQARRLVRTTATVALTLGLTLTGALAASSAYAAEGVPVPTFRGGTVAAWGESIDGRTRIPTSLAEKTVTAVAAGDAHGLALTSDGTVTAWGYDHEGQARVPAALAGKTVTAVAAGNSHSLALTSDGTVTAWGENYSGQTNVPAALTGKTVTAIAAGGYHSLALSSDGTVTAWGENYSGQTNVPAALTGKTVTAIAAGREYSLALTSDGRVTAWGRNSSGQTNVPAALAGKTVTAIAAGQDYTLALTSDGSLTGWGGADRGDADVPASLAGKTVTAIAGSTHSLALTSDGTLTVWGYNGPGEAVPAHLEGKVVTAVAGGGDFSLAITTGFAAEGDPVISGAPMPGRAVTATPSRYTATPTTLAYQWYADGAPIPGATSATYTPAADLVGRRLTVQVTATLTGHAPVVTTSAATQPVIAPPTVTLTASKTTLRRGQAATLTWSSTFASTITASAGWTGARTPAGTLTVKPTRIGTATYTLTATNAAGTATAQVQVRVTRPATRLRVKAAAKAIIDKLLKVTIRGLERGERYTIRIGKKVVAKGTAKTAKPVVRKVKLPRKPGRVAVRVIGDQPDRTGIAKLRIRRG